MTRFRWQMHSTRDVAVISSSIIYYESQCIIYYIVRLMRKIKK